MVDIQFKRALERHSLGVYKDERGMYVTKIDCSAEEFAKEAGAISLEEFHEWMEQLLAKGLERMTEESEP